MSTCASKMVLPTLPILLRLASALRTCPCKMLWMSLWVWTVTEPGRSSSQDMGALPVVVLPYVSEIAFFPPCSFTGMCVSGLNARNLICWKRKQLIFSRLPLLYLSIKRGCRPFHFIHEEIEVAVFSYCVTGWTHSAAWFSPPPGAYLPGGPLEFWSPPPFRLWIVVVFDCLWDDSRAC